MPAKKQPVKVPYKYLPRTGEIDDSQLPYMMMDALIANYHTDLAGANIAVGYSYGWKPSRDGKVILGMAKVCGAFERQLHGFDLEILLNYDFWHHPDTKDPQRKALMDHELSHPRPIMDEDLGIPKLNENGRTCYYLRKHDIEDFAEVVRRNGIWKADLEKIGQIMAEAWEDNQRAKMSDEPDHIDGSDQMGESTEPDLEDSDVVVSYSS
jgi:hypothetical protein